MRIKHAFFRPLLWVGAIDVGLSLSSFTFWNVVLNINTPSFAALVMALRLVAWISHLYALTLPVRAWQRGDASDELTLAADQALQQIQRPFLLAYSLGWVVTEVVVLTVAFRGSLDSGLYATSMLSGTSLVLSLPAVMLPTLRHAVFDLHSEIAGDLEQRGLVPKRPRLTLTRNLKVVFLSLAASALMGMGGMTAMLTGQAGQARALDEGRHLVELDVVRVQSGRALERGALVDGVDALPEALQAQLRGGEHEETSPAVYVSAAKEVQAAMPLEDGRWVVVHLPYDDSAWLLVLLLAGISLVSLYPVVLATHALSRTVVGPLERLDEATRRIVETGVLRGQGRLVSLANDEFSDLAGNFNRMLDIFEELAGAAARVAEGDLCVRLDRPGELQEAFRAMVVKLDEVVVQIRATALEVAAASAEIEASIQEQERASDEQAKSLREVGVAVGDLAESAEAITSAAAAVLDDAEQTHANTDAMVARITELGEQTVGITELLGLIAEIAERSDLLALNGSLEAVRAGEAGRGFALVAAEMRRLAERVTGIVADVGGQVSTIRSASTASQAATNESRELAENTAGAARKISYETEQQGRSTEQLAVAVHQVVEIAAATSAATSQTRATAEGLRAHAESLEQLTAQFHLRGDD